MRPRSCGRTTFRSASVPSCAARSNAESHDLRELPRRSRAQLCPQRSCENLAPFGIPTSRRPATPDARGRGEHARQGTLRQTARGEGFGAQVRRGLLTKLPSARECSITGAEAILAGRQREQRIGHPLRDCKRLCLFRVMRRFAGVFAAEPIRAPHRPKGLASPRATGAPTPCTCIRAPTLRHVPAITAPGGTRRLTAAARGCPADQGWVG